MMNAVVTFTASAFVALAQIIGCVVLLGVLITIGMYARPALRMIWRGRRMADAAVDDAVVADRMQIEGR